MEKKPSQFKINVASNLVIKLLYAFIPFILSPFVSRALLPEGLGAFTYAHSIASYFSIFISFGFINFGTKKIAECRNNKDERTKSFYNILYVRLFLFVISFGAYLVLFTCFDITRGFTNTIFFALTLVLVGSLCDLTFYFQGMERMLSFSVINFIVNIIYAVLVIFFVKTPSDLLIYTILKSSITLATSLISVALIGKEIGKPIKPKLGDLKGVFFISLKFFIPSLILTITPIIDSTMLGALSNTTQVGYYEAANKIKILLLVSSAAISSILLSRVSFLKYENKDEEANEKILNSVGSSLFVLVPAVVGIFIISHIFMPLYYGIEFTVSINVMYCLLPSALFSSLITIILFGYYFATGKTKTATIIILICDALNIITNIFAIKYLGAIGAAITSSFANGLMLVLSYIYCRKVIRFKSLLGNFYKIIFSTGAMAISTLITIYVVSSFLSNAIVLIISAIAVGGISYIVSSLAFEETYTLYFYGRIKELFSRKKNKVEE